MKREPDIGTKLLYVATVLFLAGAAWAVWGVAG